MKWNYSIFVIVSSILGLFTFSKVIAQEISPLTNNKKEITYEKVGRGDCEVKQGILKNKNAYACFGDSGWSDYQFEFDAKVPSSAKKVEIWAGFRASDRDDRYVVALKGGIQNDLYLARLGYMGRDDFLALRH